jgi:hypothetical protein
VAWLHGVRRLVRATGSPPLAQRQAGRARLLTAYLTLGDRAAAELMASAPECCAMAEPVMPSDALGHRAHWPRAGACSTRTLSSGPTFATTCWMTRPQVSHTPPSCDGVPGVPISRWSCTRSASRVAQMEHSAAALRTSGGPAAEVDDRHGGGPPRCVGGESTTRAGPRGAAPAAPAGVARVGLPEASRRPPSISQSATATPSCGDTVLMDGEPGRHLEAPGERPQVIEKSRS